MKTIRNTTTHPIKVPLPRGKVLHLGPRKNGEIAANAVDHPPLVKLVEAGEIEIVGEGHHPDPQKPASDPTHASTHGHNPVTGSHQYGDR